MLVPVLKCDASSSSSLSFDISFKSHFSFNGNSKCCYILWCLLNFMMFKRLRMVYFFQVWSTHFKCVRVFLHRVFCNCAPFVSCNKDAHMIEMNIIWTWYSILDEPKKIQQPNCDFHMITVFVWISLTWNNIVHIRYGTYRADSTNNRSNSLYTFISVHATTDQKGNYFSSMENIPHIHNAATCCYFSFVFFLFGWF